jgi:hypothetical protein
LPQTSFFPLLWRSALWAAICAGSAALNLALAERLASAETAVICATFLFGGFLAWPVSHGANLWLMRPGWSASRCAALRLLLLSAATVAFTALVFAMFQRSYYAQWHGPILSPRWILTFGFTMLAGSYQFLVLGLRLFFPLAFAALLVLLLWDLRRLR